ncbi:MAG: holo-[acyl-carrier-protein] synthase [Ignavibacteria bacterium]|nr:holo-[acyl-carrier-protein] synthase [Ignavibacteria bacterium]
MHFLSAMIDGIGVDVLDLKRLERILKQWGNIFHEKILTEKEIAYCLSKQNSAQHIAARFAAKEAIAKSFSFGWRGVFRWKDIEIINDESGKPHVFLANKLQNLLADRKIHLSLSHSETTVIAFAVIEK